MRHYVVIGLIKLTLRTTFCKSSPRPASCKSKASTIPGRTLLESYLAKLDASPNLDLSQAGLVAALVSEGVLYNFRALLSSQDVLTI